MSLSYCLVDGRGSKSSTSNTELRIHGIAFTDLSTFPPNRHHCFICTQKETLFPYYSDDDVVDDDDDDDDVL